MLILRLNFNIYFWSLNVSLSISSVVCLFNDALKLCSIVPVCRRSINNDLDDY
jgi:hypothetical protein